MARVFNVGDTKVPLSRLIARAEAGEEVILARDGAPVARIVPLERPVGETVALLRRERARRPRVSAAENREFSSMQENRDWKFVPIRLKIGEEKSVVLVGVFSQIEKIRGAIKGIQGDRT